MMVTRRTLFLFAAMVVSGFALPAKAQTARALEISGAYVYVHDPSVDVTFPAGWAVGVAKGVNGWLSVAAAYDDSRRTFPTVAGDLRLGVRTIMAGGQASARLGRAMEFGQILAGIVQQSGSAFGIAESSTNFSAQAGAGLDLPVSPGVAVRVELDYRVFVIRHGTDIGRQFRGLTGVVFKVF